MRRLRHGGTVGALRLAATTWTAAPGTTILTGGSGADTVCYASAGSGVTVNLSTTGPQNTGGAGTDTLSESRT